MMINSGPPPIFIFMVVLFVGIIAFTIIKGMVTWTDNMSQPVQEAHATVVAKRTEVTGHSEGRTWTTYYCTFELPDGTRNELKVRDRDYGLLIEGDRGQLSFQGTWFRGFSRRSA